MWFERVVDVEFAPVENKSPLDKGDKGSRKKKNKREQKPEIDKEAEDVSNMDPFQAMKGKAKKKKKKKLTIGEQLAQTHAHSHETQAFEDENEEVRIAKLGVATLRIEVSASCVDIQYTCLQPF